MLDKRKVTNVNRTFPSLHEGSLEITLTVPLIRFVLAPNY